MDDNDEELPSLGVVEHYEWLVFNTVYWEDEVIRDFLLWFNGVK